MLANPSSQKDPSMSDSVVVPEGEMTAEAANIILQEREKQDRAVIQQRMQSNFFPVSCSCRRCFSDGYNNFSFSCLINYIPEDVVVKPRARPVLAIDKHGSYAEAQLAQAAIAYFTRKPEEMDADQRAAIKKVRSPDFQGKISELGDSNLMRFKVSDINDILKEFSRLYFFDSLAKIHFEWLSNSPTHTAEQAVTACGQLADATTILADDVSLHKIRMHPFLTNNSLRYMRQVGITLIEERAGSILHELIHCYLQLHACQSCRVSLGYQGAGHGRAFQLIAKAIEKTAWSLLDVSANLGRLDSILGDRRSSDKKEQPHPELCGPSVHDMGVYGFLEPTSRRSRYQKELGVLEPLGLDRKRRRSNDSSAADVQNDPSVIWDSDAILAIAPFSSPMEPSVPNAPVNDRPELQTHEAGKSDAEGGPAQKKKKFAGELGEGISPEREKLTVEKKEESGGNSGGDGEQMDLET